MGDWPRSIRPEDRVKYLIQARADLGLFRWYADSKHEWVAVTDRSDRVWIIKEADVLEAWHSSDMSPERLVGEFDDLREAQKALIDHLVVLHAISQSWEDVAT